MSQVDNLTQVMKVPPQAIEAEQSVLGSMMLDNSFIDDVFEILKPDNFYTHTHQLIFNAIQSLNSESRPIDLVTVREYLDNNHKLDSIGGLAYLDQLTRNTPSTKNVLTYAQIIKDCFIRRELIYKSNAVIELSYSPGDRSIEQLISESQSLIDSAIMNVQSISTDSIRRIGQDLPAYIDRLESSEKYEYPIKIGISEVSRLVPGLKPGNVVVVAGRPGHGKSTFALNIAENNSIFRDKKSVVFSMEMPREELIDKTTSRFSKVPLNRIRDKELFSTDYKKISDASSKIMNSELYFDDTSSLDHATITAKIKRENKKSKIDLVVVDYVQILEGNQKDRHLVIADFARAMKKLAKEYKLSVIMVSQLGRLKGKYPTNEDLSWSRALEENADVIMMTFDESMEKEQRSQNIRLFVTKNKNGSIGRAWLKADWAYSTLSSGTEPQEQITEEEANNGFD